MERSATQPIRSKPLKAPAIARQPKARQGFTLVEMLSAIAILVLLLALLTPSLSNAREAARVAECASNLHQIHAAMLNHRVAATMGRGQGGLPAPSEWVARVIEQGVSPALICPSDETTEIGPGALAGYYIVQDGDVQARSYLSDILLSGTASDPQISWKYQGNENFTHFITRSLSGKWAPNLVESWVLPALGVDSLDAVPDNWAFIAVEWSGLITIEFGDPTTIYPHERTGRNTGSNQWIEYDGVEVMRLGGRQNDTGLEDPPIVIPGAPSSYGMNNQVEPRGARSGQLMHIEYETIIVDVDGEGTGDDDFHAEFAPRHLGIANGLHVDGSVEQFRRDQVDPLLHENASLWQHRFNAGD